MVFGSVQAQYIYQDDVNSFLYPTNNFGATSVKDKLNNLGFTVNKSYLDYDKLGHIEFLSATNNISKLSIGGTDSQSDKTALNSKGNSDSKKSGISKGHLRALAVAGAANYVQHGHPLFYDDEYKAVQRSVNQWLRLQRNNTSVANLSNFTK